LYWARLAVTARVGRLENSDRSAGTTGAEAAAVADLKPVDVRKIK
jgi:hypothetical protein